MASIFFLKTWINHCCPCLFFSVKRFKCVGVSVKSLRSTLATCLPSYCITFNFSATLARFLGDIQGADLYLKMINYNPTNSTDFIKKCKGLSRLQIPCGQDLTAPYAIGIWVIYSVSLEESIECPTSRYGGEKSYRFVH